MARIDALSILLFLVACLVALPCVVNATPVWPPGPLPWPDSEDVGYPEITSSYEVCQVNRKNFGWFGLYDSFYERPEYSIFRVGYLHYSEHRVAFVEHELEFDGPDPEPGQGTYWPAESVPPELTWSGYFLWPWPHEPSLVAQRYFGYEPEVSDPEELDPWLGETVFSRPPEEALWPGQWYESAKLLISPHQYVDETFVSQRQGKHWHTSQSSGEMGFGTWNGQLFDDMFKLLVDAAGACVPYADIFLDIPADLYKIYCDMPTEYRKLNFVRREITKHEWQEVWHWMYTWCPLAESETERVDPSWEMGGGKRVRVINPVSKAKTGVEQHFRRIVFDLPNGDTIWRNAQNIERYKTYGFENGVPYPYENQEAFVWGKVGTWEYSEPGCDARRRELLLLPPTDRYWALQEYLAHHAHGDVPDWFPGYSIGNRPWLYPLGN